uniref:Uncharacterized protein n=1 Tax=Anopheles christyi TaxID=43041 RepID=A0A182JX22_9DIPT
MLLAVLAFILGSLIAVLLVRDYQSRHTDDYRAALNYPGGALVPVFGNLFELLFKNPVQAFTYARENASRYKASYRQWIDGKVILNVIRVKEAEKILSSTQHTRKSLLYKFLHPLMGDGLLCSKGAKWQQRRRILTPAFHFNILPKFLTIFQEESEKLVQQLDRLADGTQAIVLQSIVTSFALHTICETAMGVKLDAYREADEYKQKVYEVGEMLVHRTMSPWLYNDRVYRLLGYDGPLARSLKPIHHFTRSIIRQRRETFQQAAQLTESNSEENLYFGGKQRYAMLDTLLAAEARAQIDEEGIREEVDTFMFEGHDTTAAAIMFTIVLLAIEQEVQDRCYKELQEVAELSSESVKLSLQDYQNLPYLDRVIKESLRLYPPVAFISRATTGELAVDGTTFPHNTMSHIHIYDLHRDPIQFPDPERFDPDRFLPEVAEKRNPYAYVPFSAGPRNCIGQKFAQLEVKTVLVAILQRFRIKPVTRREEIVFMADLVLRAQTPLKQSAPFTGCGGWKSKVFALLHSVTNMTSEWNVPVHSPLILATLAVLLLLLLWMFWDLLIDKRGPTYAALRQFPGPPVWPLIGTLYHSRGLDAAKTFVAFRYWTALYGGSYKLWLNSYLFILNITRCQEAEPFFNGPRNADKSMLYRFLHPFIGIGLLNSAGTKWLQRRRILTPTFHFNILNGFHRTFCEESEKLAAKIDSQRDGGREAVEIELQSAMSQLTLNTICETSMGVKLDTLDGAREYREGIYKVGDMLLNRAVRPWLYVDWTWHLLGYMHKLHRLLKPLHLFTTRIIAQRRELFAQGKLKDLSAAEDITPQDDHSIYSNASGGKKRYAMLDTLLTAEMQGLIDPDGIREEVETFMFEGHDTTGSALVFIFLTLSWEPEIQERLYQELYQFHSQNEHTDGHLSPNDLNSMKFFDRVIKECLRLWPPVAFISRSVTEEINLPDGRSIPKGCIANLHIFDLHRDPVQFPDPERFDPDRFLPERVAERNPYAYVPFSAGQRNCIGQKYALLEVKTAVAYLVLRYRILPVTKRAEIRFIADLVLRSATPLKPKSRRSSSVQLQIPIEMDIITVVLLLVVFLLVLFELRVQLSAPYRAGKKFPGPQALPLLGNAHNLLFNDQRRTFQLPRGWAAKYGDTYRLLVRGLLNLNAIQAKDVEPLLSSPKLIDKSIVYTLLHQFLGIGLLNSTGSKWQHRRRILTPAFHFNILPSFLLTFQEECRSLVAHLGQYADKGTPVALQPFATKFTLNTICETAMGIKLDSMTMANEYRSKIEGVGTMLLQRLMNPWLFEDFNYKLSGLQAKFEKLLQPVHAFTRSIIQQRRELFHKNVTNIGDFSEENIYTNLKQRYAMLDTLLAAEAKEQIDEDGIREEVDTFMFEGHDTTSAAIIFTLLLLAHSPEAQQRLYEELQEIALSRSDATDGADFTQRDYNELKYMDMVLKESLRLYPPVPFISRNISEDTMFGDRLVPKDTLFNVHIFDLHRDPAVFPDPERFDPDRFLPENVAERSPYAYVPFSAGPRNCIGQRFAILELKTVLAGILLHFRILPVTKREEVVFVADLILRTKDPIMVKFERRHKDNK